MKNILRTVAIAIIALFTGIQANAQVITAERAGEIAKQFFANGKQKAAAYRSTNVALTQSADSRAITGDSDEAPTYHIFTGTNGKGFVIVSGEETENPIIGYSFDNTIDTNNLPDGFVDYMSDIDAQVRALREYNAANPQKAAAARSAMQKAADYEYNATSMGEIVVDLKTAPWGQHGPFNKLCPVINGVNAVTGCVPTAFAILCHYYQWPESGSGTYTNSGQTIDISTSTYDYASMRNDNYPSGQYTEAEANAVALLMRDLGFAYGVLYGTSSTDKSENASTLKSAFSYKSEYNPSGSGMDAMWRSSVGDETFIASLKECLDKERPIPFSSKSTDPETGQGSIRHIFILDGYTENNYFHFNYGWNGSGNGWYTIDFMQPDDASDYSTEQRAYLDLIPNRTPRTVTVSANPAGAGTVTVNDNENSAEVTEGTYATLKATANSGYTFSYWSKGGVQVSTEKTYKVPVAAEGNDYVANFLTVGNTRVNVSVSYNSSYGTVAEKNGTTVSGTGLTPYQNSEITLVATPLDGYVFNGWTVIKGTNSTNYSGTELTFVATENMNIEANFSLTETDYIIDNTTGTALTSIRVGYWEHNSIELTLSTDEEGIAYNGYISLFAGATGSKTYTLTAPTGYTITKYKFSQCRSQSTSSTYNLSIVADTEYPLTTSDQDITISNVNAATAQFTVKGDAGRSMYTKQIIVTLRKDGTGGAITPVTYSINITKNPTDGGSITINGAAVSQKSVTEGTLVTVVATPAAGYKFDGWEEGTTTLTTNTSYSFTANSNKSLTANFSKADYTVTVAAGEGGVAYIGTKGTTSTTVDYNTNITITAEANDGYEFVEWRAFDSHFTSNAQQNVTVTTDVTYTAVFRSTTQQGTTSLAGKYFRLKEKSTGTYMNIYDNSSHGTQARGGVNVATLNENSDAQIFQFIESGTNYKLQSKTGYYIYCQSWNVDAYSTASANGTELTLEPTATELEYLINCAKGYFKIDPVDGNASLGNFVYCNANNGSNGYAATWVLEEVVMQKVYIKAEIEGWRDNNPNTHLGTITIGGTAMKLTPEHQTASELTMPVVEGTTLEFTRKYRGFEFNGFYIGDAELGQNHTLTADNVAAINETTPLVAKFTATDDVTLFYDDDEFSYRIPAIVKTGTNRLVAISDYRHSHDDIGRDNHGTGTLQVDLVMRTSEDNGLTWTDKVTIAEGNQNFGYGDAAAVANGDNILVMAVAGNVFYAYASSSSKQRTYRIYSTDNGDSWTKEEISSNLYTLFPNGYGMFFGSGKLVVDPDFNGSGNARVYGAVLLKDSNGERNYVLYSDDWGATWNILGGTSPASQNEPKVEILPNGQILLSSRRSGGRTFNVFTYSNKATSEGTWDTAANGCNNDGNSTNGEIICLDAKRTNGQPTKILLQSQPSASARSNVSIWYKELTGDNFTASDIASGWTKGLQVSDQLSAYSAMCLQENGEVALFFEEAPCHNDDATYGYSMVYVPLTIEEITNDNFRSPSAVVETVTVDVTLTDTEGNTYTHQFNYLPGDAAKIDAALTTAYPFITLGAEGNLQGSGTAYTYTNTVTLPFKVSNATNTYWHNIYWPANTNENLYPIYMLANTATDTQVAKVNTSTQYGNSQYNTYNYADKLSWAIYSVDGTLNFKLKNKVTQKYIQVTSVGTGNEKNAVYAEEGEATAFTLQEGTGSRENSYNLIAKVGETTGYLCSTSTSNSWATHYNGANGNNHHGAWVKFVESPDYWTIYDQLIADINNFGAGDGKYTENATISNIDKDALRTMLFSELTAQATAVQTVKDSYTEITLTVPAVNDVVPGSVEILNERVSHKFVPKGNVTIEAFPAAGYRFVNWTRPAAAASAAARTAEARNSNVVSEQNPYTVTVSEALSLEANFELIVVNATLTDAQSNEYEVQVSGFTTEVTKDAVADKLREAYPYITLGTTDQEGNVIDFGVLNIDGTAYTYTNRVELPFKVSNTTYIWHNIYWPSNTKNNDWPVYLSASTADDTYVPKVTGSYAYGDHPTYNTKSGNNNISWAIYNVNKGFEFIFKNKVTQKYIRIRNVADEDAQNVQYVENAEDATAFTIEMKPEGQTYDTDAKYALAAMFGETKGYLCSTSVGYDWVTHYYNAINNGYGHQGAWIEFKEAPDYYSKIMDLGIMLGYKFGAGDGKYIITDAISEINDHIANNSENITLNTIKQDSIVLNDAINNWPAVGLTINPVEGGTTNINGEENVVHKYVPNGYELPLAAVPAEGYHFVSWTDGTDEVKTAEYTKTISGGKGDVIELTANFAKDSYTVAVTAEEGGSATTSVATVEHGSEVTLTATANDGYKFIGWYNGEELVDTNNPYTFAVTSDINYTAKFSESASTPTTHAIHIIVSSTDGTEVTNSENGNVKAVFEMSNDWITDYDFADGVDVILVATPDYGQQAYLFDGWYKNGVLVSNELSYTVKATEDATFEARFFRGCVIIGKSNSNRLGYIESITLADGTSLGYDASNRAAVRKGTIVKLNPRIENGYTVGNWTDVNGNVVSEDESLIIEVNEDVTYTANFEPVSYKLTVRANDDSYGTVNAVSEIESGKTIKVGNAMVATITATANTGYKFVYWTKGTDVVSYDAEYTVPAIADVSETEDTEYVANFVELETAEPGVYYRFAYEFPAAAAASAARTGATRAAGDTYTYAVNYGTGTSNNISNGKAQEWVYTNNNNEPTLTLRATVADTPVYAINMGANATANPKLYAHGSDGNSLITPVKYTLSVPEGYIIVNYSFEYYVYNDSEFAIDGISQTRRTWLNLSVNANNQTAEFTLSSTNNTNYMIVRNFTVTIQEVGSGEGEGEGGEGEGEGGETPETVKYYIQSEACGVTNKTNALLMEQDGESASSIFYYDNNKLLSYKEGRYLDESNSARGLQAVGAAGGDVEIIDNKIKVSSGTTVVYLHANKNEGTSTTYFVDRCTSRDGSDNGDEEHNFIVEEVTTLPVTISSALHATFYAPVAVSIPEGVKAYVLKEKDITAGSYVTMTLLTNGIIPANTGVILKSEEATTYYFNITENTDEARAEVVGNILEGTVAKSYVNKDAYILTKKSNGVGMYPLSNNSYITGGATATFTNNSHKAYLPVEGNFAELLKSSNGFRFVFDDDNTTGVEDIERELEDTIYDLQGRKLNEITEPGIYIVGGKKVWIK